MAGAFTKPRFNYDYNLNQEKENFDSFFIERNIPVKNADEIDIATWNIANLGVQKRRDKDLKLIAYILSRFDIIAVQEVRSNLSVYNKVIASLKPLGFKTIFTDVAGGGERMSVIYNSNILEQNSLVGELDYNPNGTVVNGEYVVTPKKQKFKLNGANIETYFDNFNRNPFLTTWKVKKSNLSFLLANVHIFYGKKEDNDPARFNNRIAEVYFLADWAKEMQRSKNKDKVFEQNIVLIGDMNIPKMSSDDKVYRALKRRGFVRTKYSSKAGTTIKDFMTYDQIIFANDKLRQVEINNYSAVVVDFDNFIFKDLWNQVEDGNRTLTQFKAWTKFAISDHRPVFVRVKIN